MDSEFRIYAYISQVLKDLGWDTRNPNRGGDVYNQHEFYNHDDILTKTLNNVSPENIIRIPWNNGFHYWIVEAKSNHKDLKKGLEEAKSYSDKINANKILDNEPARFATGIAGSPNDTFLVETHYWNGREWNIVSINNYATTGFLSLQQCRDIINWNKPNLESFDDNSEKFLTKANNINTTLHNNGITIADRAKVLGSLLLALAEDGNMRIHKEPRKMINEINTNIEIILTKHGKKEFVDKIKLDLPATEKNHNSYRKAIVDTLQVLREMNVRSAINSGDDALGKFYETFLKYATGAKDMGIVLTPRHITKFAVDCIGVTWRDGIYDPTCGTGGFLVAAMDNVRKTSSSKNYEQFKKNSIWGVEHEDPVYSLALVNMIFRGDGKSGLQDGNCFDHEFWETNGNIFYTLKDQETTETNRPFTRVFMNPPFAVSEPSINFVDHALKQMKPNGLMFAVLPNSPICGLSSKNKFWRRETLKRHTIKACIKLPSRLFIPNASKGTYGLIIEAWKPHHNDEDTLFAILYDDEHASNLAKTQSKTNIQDNLVDISSAVKSFLNSNSINEIPKEITKTKIRSQNGYDFSPEAYVAEHVISSIGILDITLNLTSAIRSKAVRNSPPNPKAFTSEKLFSIDEIMILDRGKCPPIKSLDTGEIPVITTQEQLNGIADYCDVSEKFIFSNKITISANGSGGAAFWHPYRFAATTDVLIGTLQEEMPKDLEFILYVCGAISSSSWRYDYYRKCSSKRLIHDIKIALPQKNGDIDMDEISKVVKKTYGIDELKNLLNKHNYMKTDQNN